MDPITFCPSNSDHIVRVLHIYRGKCSLQQFSKPCEHHLLLSTAAAATGYKYERYQRQ